MKKLFYLLLALMICDEILGQKQTHFNHSFSLPGYSDLGGAFLEVDSGYIVSSNPHAGFPKAQALMFLDHQLNIKKSHLIVDTFDYQNAFISGFYNYPDGFVQFGRKASGSRVYAFLAKFQPNLQLDSIFQYGNYTYQQFNSGMVLENGSGFLGIGAAADTTLGNRGRLYAVKIAYDGKMLWERVYGNFNELFVGFSVDNALLENTYVISAWRGSNSNNTKNALVWIDDNGDVLLEKIYPNGVGGSGLKTSLYDSTYVMAGSNAQNFERYPIIRKVDRMGNIIWEKILGQKYLYWYFYTNIVIDEKGKIVVGGRYYSNAEWGVFMAAFDANGDSLWLHTYQHQWSSGSGRNEMNYLIPTSDNGYLMSGNIEANGQKIWAIKVDSLGCEEYNCAPASVAFEEEEAFELKIYPNPNNGQFDIVLPEDFAFGEMSIYSSTGQLVFKERINGANNIHNVNTQLTNGIYLLQVIGDNNAVFYNKIMLQR